MSVNLDYWNVKRSRFRVHVMFRGYVEIEAPENITKTELLAEKVVMSQIKAGLLAPSSIHNSAAYKEYLDLIDVDIKATKTIDAVDDQWKQVKTPPDMEEPVGSWECTDVRELRCTWEELDNQLK